MRITITAVTPTLHIISVLSIPLGTVKRIKKKSLDDPFITRCVCVWGGSGEASNDHTVHGLPTALTTTSTIILFLSVLFSSLLSPSLSFTSNLSRLAFTCDQLPFPLYGFLYITRFFFSFM